MSDTIKLTKKEVVDILNENVYNPMISLDVYHYYYNILKEMDYRGWDYIIIEKGVKNVR